MATVALTKKAFNLSLLTVVESPLLSWWGLGSVQAGGGRRIDSE